MALISCVKCGRAYSDAVDVCPHCRYAPELFVCPECGTVYMKGEIHCGNCGFPLHAGRPTPADGEAILNVLATTEQALKEAEDVPGLEKLHRQLLAVSAYMDISATLRSCENKLAAAKLALQQADAYARANAAAEKAEKASQWAAVAQAFESLGQYLDSSHKAVACRQKEAQLKKSKKKKLFWLGGGLVGLAVAAAIVAVVLLKVIIPGNHYSAGDKLYAQAAYDQAAEEYLAAGKYGVYKDAAEKAENAQYLAQLQSHYNTAAQAMEKGNYDVAIAEFEKAKTFQDAPERVLEANYAAGNVYLGRKSYAVAVDYFRAANNYADSEDKLFLCGMGFVETEQFLTAQKIFEELDNPEYVRYAKAKQKMANIDYLGAAELLKNLYVEDSRQLLKQCYYSEGKRNLNTIYYDQARGYFNLAGDYSDAKAMLTACDLMEAESYWDRGWLNTAKEKYEKLPAGYSYGGVSRDGRLAQLEEYSKFVALCGDWNANVDSCKARVRQTKNSDSSWHEWTTTYSSLWRTLTVTCIIHDDGTVTIQGTGYYYYHTLYSEEEEGLNLESKIVSFTYTGKEIPSEIEISDTETLKISNGKFTLDYSYTDRSQSSRYTYLYRSTWVYDKLESDK